MITENVPTLKIHKLSQAQYDREAAVGNLESDAIYLTPDDLFILSSNNYGPELPDGGTVGRVYLKKA